MTEWEKEGQPASQPAHAVRTAPDPLTWSSVLPLSCLHSASCQVAVRHICLTTTCLPVVDCGLHFVIDPSIFSCHWPVLMRLLPCALWLFLWCQRNRQLIATYDLSQSTWAWCPSGSVIYMVFIYGHTQKNIVFFEFCYVKWTCVVCVLSVVISNRIFLSSRPPLRHWNHNNILVKHSLLFLTGLAVLFPIISVRPQQVLGPSRNRKWKWVIKADPGLPACPVYPAQVWVMLLTPLCHFSCRTGGKSSNKGDSGRK